MHLHLRANAATCPSLQTYNRVEKIRGFFNKDDAMHFALLLGYQDIAGTKGDVLEIGSWFGRSTAFIASYIGANGRLIVCDAFELESRDQYHRRPNLAEFQYNIKHCVPDFDLSRLLIYPCLSAQFEPPADAQLRFAHIDGGHGYDEAMHDLRLVAELMVPGGVIVVDDFAHPRWPDVRRAVDAFLTEDPRFGLAASLNRWQATGQKAYIVRSL